MTADEQAARWLSAGLLTADTLETVSSMLPEEREEAFSCLISFGTSGLRGIMGPGTARMNELTVRLAARGLAAAIPLRQDIFYGTGVCICYDCRNNSRRYAEICAETICEAGIPVLFFSDMRPTPELSFAVRHYGCAAGINITASHNPSAYNGMKVYGADGGQLVTEPAAAVAGCMAQADLYQPAEGLSFEECCERGQIRLLGQETDEAFLAAVSETLAPCGSVPPDFKIVYTPFHGTGAALIPEALKRFGARDVYCVPEQMVPDGNFSTVASPNPEYRESFRMAEALADQVGADWIIGSDPDADRLAVMYRDKTGTFIHPSFSLTGAVLLDWYARRLRSSGCMPERPVILKSLVTTKLAEAAAAWNGCRCVDTFTGFKYLTAEKDRLEQQGEGNVIFSYEESYGCMVGDFCRDKDSVSAAVMLCCMAAELRKAGQTFGDALQNLYDRVGYHNEKTISLKAESKDGKKKMAQLMERLRRNPPASLAGQPVMGMQDLLAGTEVCPGQLPVPSDKLLKGEDVLRFVLQDGSDIIMRPSGTEPVLRLYLMVQGEPKSCDDALIKLENWAHGLLE